MPKAPFVKRRGVASAAALLLCCFNTANAFSHDASVGGCASRRFLYGRCTGRACSPQPRLTLPRLSSLIQQGGGAPGGTIDTVVTTLDKITKPKAPHAKPQSGDASAAARSTPKGETRVSPLLPAYLPSVEAWCAPWFMGAVNSKTVQRSNALVGFAPHLQYIELQEYPTILAFLAGAIPAAVGITLFALPPVQKLCFSMGILPKPGEGAMTRDQMAKGFVKFTTTASDLLHGHSLSMTMAGAGDPGCILTAIFMGESAALLAEDFNKTALKGAGLTPVAVLGADRLRARLQESGRVAIVNA